MMNRENLSAAGASFASSGTETAAQTATTWNSVTSERERLGNAGLYLLLAAVALAPVMGGTPPGALRGADPAIGALRILVLLVALCLAIAWPPAKGDADRSSGGAARIGVWTLFGLTLLSLIVHSRFFTSPVLLFAMVPATLDWLCYALVFTLAFGWRATGGRRRCLSGRSWSGRPG
jgi:hypothetical protein